MTQFKTTAEQKDIMIRAEKAICTALLNEFPQGVSSNLLLNSICGTLAKLILELPKENDQDYIKAMTDTMRYHLGILREVGADE